MDIIEAETIQGRIWKTFLCCIIGFLCIPVLTVMGFIRMRKMPAEDLHRRILKGSLWFGAIASFFYLAGMPFLLWFLLIKPLSMDMNPETGEHLPSVTWLMPEATDISFYKSHSVNAYEFSIPEDVFVKNLSAQDLQEITEPVTIPRYLKFLQQARQDPPEQDTRSLREMAKDEKISAEQASSVLPNAKADPGTLENHPAAAIPLNSGSSPSPDALEAVVTNGLVCKVDDYFRKSILIAYDRDQKKVYYFSAIHSK